MKVSVNFVRGLVGFDLPPVPELVKRIGSQLGEVENVVDLGAHYKNIYVVRVVECAKLENSDHLNICQIDDGGANQEVERLDNGLIQVLTGAPNVYKGMFAVWIAPGATVPESFDKDPFVLTSRKMRGEMSHGMLASPRELGLGEYHEGLLELTERDLRPQEADSEGVSLDKLVGQPFAEAFGLDDTIIEIENKMFTHRPDCFGQLGVAREIYSILQPEPANEPLDNSFDNPDWYWKIPKFETQTLNEVLELEVFNDNPSEVPRFMACTIQGVQVGQSPLWLKAELTRLGGKPINNVVDATNYIMLVSAQPVHAYDYDKLRGHKLGARLAKKGEVTKLLNGKGYQLDPSDIVIADGEGIIGLAGIMGGLDSEVTAETKSIVLEVATFDMYSVRKSSMRHGLFTDALTRFNKGQSKLQNDRVMAKLMQLITGLAGGQAGHVFDVPAAEFDKTTLAPELKITAGFINNRLGTNLSTTQIGNVLRPANFAVYPDEKDENTLVVTAPFWRTDIELPEDIVEEVGRLYGYDKLPLGLPKRSIKPAAKNDMLELKSKIRENLVKAGANEVLTYSFVHGNLFDKVGQDRNNAFKLANALSPDLQYYRLSLIPSLLEKVHPNIKAGVDEFALFEIGKAHITSETSDDGLPREDDLVALVVAAGDKLKKPSAAYYLARKYLVNLLGTQPTFKSVPSDMQKFDITKPFDMNRTSLVYVGDVFVGLAGEFRQQVARNLKLPKYCAGFELDTATLAKVLNSKTGYIEQPKYPKVEQDISLKVPSEVEYQALYDSVWGALLEARPDHSLPKLTPRDIYQKDDDKDHKQIAFHFEISSYDKTMTTTEVAKMLDQAAQAAEKQCSAERL